MIKIRVMVSKIRREVIYIELSGEDFLNYNPPCNECLINNMCITDRSRSNYKIWNTYIEVKYCYPLKKFIDGNKRFFYTI